MTGDDLVDVTLAALLGTPAALRALETAARMVDAAWPPDEITDLLRDARDLVMAEHPGIPAPPAMVLKLMGEITLGLRDLEAEKAARRAQAN